MGRNAIQTNDLIMTTILTGKVKTVISTSDPNEVLIQYEDRVTAGNGKKELWKEGKGKVCCEISEILFKKLEEAGIKTHYISMPTHRAMCCTKVDIVPLEVIVRNLAAGSIVRQTTIPKARLFYKPLVEFHLKDDSKNDPLLTPDRMRIMGYEPETFIETALAINTVLIKLFHQIDLDLVDFKIEFGYDSEGNLLLADELSPDSCRLWKTGTRESMDKDLFRNETGDLINSYQIVLNQLKGIE